LELITANDFSEAQSVVKLFKNAEKTLKQAKTNAIKQINDIQELFDAVDEIVEKARQSRLTLERQIKTRTAEIKEEIIQTGVDEIIKYIESNSLSTSQDWKKYTDRSIFQAAIKGKRGSKGAKLAVNDVCDKIKLEIDNKILQSKVNQTILDTIPLKHKAIFQDQSYLLSLNEDELNSVINKRVNAFNQNKIIDKATISSFENKSVSDNGSTYSNTDIDEIRHVLKALLDGCTPMGEVIDSADKLNDTIIKRALNNCLDILEKNF